MTANVFDSPEALSCADPFLQEQFWDDYGTPHDRRRFRAVLDLLPRDCGRLLDLGCGDGRLARLLARRGETAGMDISLAALRRAGVPATAGSAWSLPFRARSFDTVVCCEMLEHVPEDRMAETLRELTRVSSRYLLVTVPNEQDLMATSRTCSGCGTLYQIHGHLRSFSVASLCELLTGFEPLSTTTLANRVWAVAPWMERLRRSLLDVEPVSPHAACPRCGSRPDPDGRVKWLVRKGSSAIGKICPPRAVDAGWIVGLFGRK